ncbi:MAG: glycosyltransferase [Aeoliella sp.]
MSATLPLADHDAPNVIPFERPQQARVLHVINGEHYSGAERVQDLLALRLPECGYNVGLATLKPGRFEEVRLSVDSPLYNVHMRGRLDLRAVREVMRIAREGDYQLLHAHTPRTAMVTAIASRWTGRPWVYHVHSPVSLDSGRVLQNRINSLVERWSLRSAARAIVVSPTLLPYMKECGFAADRLTCVPNGVPVCDSPRVAHSIDGDLTIGMVALFRPRKGIETLLESLAMLVSRGYQVRFHAIGSFETPDYEAEIHALVERLDLQEHVDFVGFTADVAGELNRLDAMVLPSLYGEGLPMVVLEAMAAGVPVVASHVEGISTAIEHRESGLLVEPGSVSQLATALEQFLNGEVDPIKFAAASVNRHREIFSDLAMARGVAEVYAEVLEAVRLV